MELSASIFGIKFKVSRFTSFLSWTGIIFCVLMMIVSLALLTIPTDFEPFLQILQYQLIINGVLPEDFDEHYLGVFMYVLGGFLLTLSLSLFSMYELLRKRNQIKNEEGVMNILKVICYFKSAVEILIFFSTFALEIVLLKMMKINLREMKQPWILITANFLSYGVLSFCIIFKILSFAAQKSKPLRALIIFQYFILTLAAIGVTAVSIYFSVILSQFLIILLGASVMMFLTFIWIFDVGFIINLYTILKKKEKEGNIFIISGKKEEVNDA